MTVEFSFTRDLKYLLFLSRYVVDLGTVHEKLGKKDRFCSVTCHQNG